MGLGKWSEFAGRWPGRVATNAMAVNRLTPLLPVAETARLLREIPAWAGRKAQGRYGWPMDRVVLGRMQNPVRGILHGSAAAVSIWGLIALLARSDDAGIMAASAVYGLALIGMYLTSAVYHSVPWRPCWKARLQVLDHTFIYALVAATFSVLALGVGGGPWVILGLGGVWALVALGLGRELTDAPARRVLLPLQVMAVTVALPALSLTLDRMDPATATLTVAGGACYLLGVYLFVHGRPRLAPRVFSHHEFFHLMVIVSSIVHFVAVWRVVSPV